VGLKADIFVDGGAELSKVSLEKSATLAGLTREVFFTRSGATTRATIGGNSNDLNGALLFPDGQPRFGTIYVNGGSGTHASAMGAAGRQAIETFHASGGSYTGSCAGEFIAAFRIPALYGGYVGNPGRKGTQTVTFDETDHPLVQYLVGWNGGSNVVTGIPHYWGPRNSESYRHPDGTEFLGTITRGLYTGTDFLIEYQKSAESGGTILSPSHPEYNRNASNTALMAAILKRADDLSKVEPDIKGTLTTDQSVVMSDPTQRIGDGQYHRYRVEVPEGTSVLYVGLTGLTGNADLFVQHNGVAHSDSYLAKSEVVGTADDLVVIQNPEPGTYEISVLGAHAILNGAAYTLSVDWVDVTAVADTAVVDAVFAEAESAPEMSSQDISAVWPKGVGVKADIFVDGGDYTSKKSLDKPANLAGLTREVYFSRSAATTRRLIGGNADDLNGVLLFPDGQPRFSTIFVNGKNSPRHSRALGETGRQAIADFYSAGGSYTGSCGGEFMAAYYIPSLWGGEVYRHGNTGQQTVTFTEDHPIVDYLKAWNGGSHIVSGIPYYWGPVNRSTYRHPDNTEFLGTVTGGVYKGADFLVEYQRDAKSGVAVLSPAHPEYSRTNSHVALMAAILRRANELARVEPDIKGVLTLEQSVEMNSPTQKIGDGQYHRYTLEVPAGVSELQVSLTGLTGNADLFIQRDGVAYAGSYLSKSDAAGNADDLVVIENPVAGTYEISVFGAHTILNGAAYTLEVKAPVAVNAALVDAVFAEGEQCHCRTDTGTIASPWRTRLEERVAELEQERDEARELLEAAMRLLTALDVEVVESGSPFFVS
jgi:glutamine amidotransferase-like uncharacterized protein